MLVRKLAKLAALVSLAVCPVAAQQAPRTVTLDEAIRLAESVRPAVVQAEATRRNADAQRRTATGAYLPSLTGTANANTITADGNSRTDPNTGQIIPGNTNSKSVRLGVTGSLLLFDGFRRSASTRVANAQIESADASLLDARLPSRLTVTPQYYLALANQQLLRVLEAAVKTAEEQLRQASAKLRAGSATRADSLQSLVALGTAQGNYITGVSNLAGAEATLARLIGLDGRVAAAEDSSYYAPVGALDTLALLADARERSPQILNAEAQARSAKAALDAARTGYFPTINLNGSYTFNGSSLQNYQLFNQRQLALALSWNIFDGFQREQSIAIQRSNVEVAEATANDLRRQLESTVLSQLAALDAARARVGISANSVAAGRENLRVQQQRYRLGVATIVEVLTAQQSLNQAEVDAVNARFDYLRAKAQIETTTGRPL